MTTATLEHLNSLLTQLGRATLTRWSNSKTKLVEKIALLENEVKTQKVKATKAAKILPAPKEKKTSPGEVTLVDIATAMKINDRVARQKFRKLYADKSNKGLPKKIDGKWVFARKDETKVKSLLKA